MKILLTAGCSYTDKRFMSTDSTVNSRGGWPMWPEIMGKEINLKTINMGQSGVSNQTIFNNIIDGINQYGDRIDTIAVLWTSFDRMQFFYNNVIPFAEMHINNMQDKNPDLTNWMNNRPAGNAIVKFLSNKNLDVERLVRHWITESLRNMTTLIDLCEAKGYKLIMGQGQAALEPMPFNISSPQKITPQMIVSQYTNNPYFKILEKKRSKTIGWPFILHINGWDFDSYRSNFPNTTVSTNDYHPNEFGQQIFADLFTNKWKKKYAYRNV